MISAQSLQGWLIKKKNEAKKYSSFLGSDKKRYFRVCEVKGIDIVELTLCYYDSAKDEEPRGSLFLKDITSIEDDQKIIKLLSPSRIMVLEAQTFGEHKMWLNGLIHFCPEASITGVQTESLSSIQARREAAVNDATEIDDSDEKPTERCTVETPIRPRNRGPKERRDKDDHRKMQSRHTGEPATSRLHGHIRKDEKDNQLSIEELGVAGQQSRDEPAIKAFLSTLPSPNRQKLKVPGSGDDYDVETLDLGKVGRIVRKIRSQDSSDDADGEDGDTSFAEDADGSSVSISKVPSKPSVAEQKKDDGSETTESRPIRRASDVLDGDGAKGERRSLVQDMISRRSPLVLDDDADQDIDIGAEKSRYQEHKPSTVSNASSGSQGRLKPPPGPRPLAAPLSSGSHVGSFPSGGSLSSQYSHGRSLTPPRMSANPGSAPDSNFVNDKWDEDSPDKKSDGKVDVINKQRDVMESKGLYSGGVKADTNWLEENFDD